MRFAPLLLLFFASRALAIDSADLPLEVDWSAPPECGDSDRVRGQTAALLRETPPGSWEARGEIARDADEWVLTLEVSGPISGRRRLRGQECEALTESAALVLALVMANPGAAEENLQEIEAAPTESEPIEVNAAESEVDPAPSNELSAPPSPTGETEEVEPELASTEPAPESEPGLPTPWSLRLGLGPLLDTGTLPALSFGGSLSVHLVLGRFRVGLEALAAGRGRADHSSGDSFARLALIGSALAVCGGGPITRWLDLWGCGRGEVGQIRGRGENVDVGLFGKAPWTAVGLEGRTMAKIRPRWAVELSVGLSVPVAARDYVLDGEIIHQAQIALRAGLSIHATLAQ